MNQASSGFSFWDILLWLCNRETILLFGYYHHWYQHRIIPPPHLDLYTYLDLYTFLNDSGQGDGFRGWETDIKNSSGISQIHTNSMRTFCKRTANMCIYLFIKLKHNFFYFSRTFKTIIVPYNPIELKDQQGMVESSTVCYRAANTKYTLWHLAFLVLAQYYSHALLLYSGCINQLSLYYISHFSVKWSLLYSQTRDSMANSIQLEIVKEIRCNMHHMLCDEKAVVCWIEVI